MADDSDERHSVAHEAILITDPDKLAALEAGNALKQFDVTCSLIDEFINTERPFRLRPSMILQLHRAALEGISKFAGNYRPAGIEIEGSEHRPVDAHLVPECVEDMCDYVNDQWNTMSPLHLAAFVMWRLNWIHPFDDGNGRTSRALSYLILCVKSGMQLPGTKTIPEQISKNKDPYYKALETADEKNQDCETHDLTELEEYLGNLLANQLLEIFNKAKGASEPSNPIFH